MNIPTRHPSPNLLRDLTIADNIVNGVEVEMSEDELMEIKSHHGNHGKVIKMHFDDEKMGDHEERIEISVEVDDEGNNTVKKIVNGEEVELTEDEMNDIHMFEMIDEDDMNIFIHSDELEENLEGLELELEELIEDGGDDVKIITRRIDIHSDEEHDLDWKSKDAEDHTIVLVTENYDEKAGCFRNKNEIRTII